MGAIATDKRRVADIVKRLRKAYPAAKCALDFKSPLELLIATILSAQCTDVRVNMVTPVLFKKYPTAEALAAAPRGRHRADYSEHGFFPQQGQEHSRMLPEDRR